MAPRTERDEEIGRWRDEAREETPLIAAGQGALPRIESGLSLVGLDYDEEQDELRLAWPTTSFERSIGLLSSPLTNLRQVEALTKSPKPGGGRARIINRTEQESCDESRSSRHLQIQKIQSLDFDSTGAVKSNKPSRHTKAKKKQGTKKEVEAKATFGQCVFNMCNTLMGIGILTLPFAIASAGWLGGILLMICCTFVTWWTCLLIGRSMNGDPRPTHFFDDSPFNAKLMPGSSQEARARSYITGLPQMATASFGKAGNIILSSVLYFELFSSLCIFLVTIGDHLFALYPVLSTSSHTIIVSILLVIPTSLLRTPRLLSYMSVVGTFSTVAIVLSVAAAALIEGNVSGEGAPEEDGHSHQPTHSLWVSSGFALSIGLVAFCYAGHAIVPSFYTSMERPQDFEKMLSCSYVIVLLCYITVGLSGYYMFGSAVDDQITLSLERGSSMEIVTTGLTWLMVLTAFSKATLYIFPLALGMEEIIAPHLSTDFCMSTASCIIKMAMIVLALLVSLFVPSFGFICALVGMVCTMIVSVIFPAASHLQLFGDKLSTTEKYLDWIVISMGIVVAVLGTNAIV